MGEDEKVQDEQEEEGTLAEQVAEMSMGMAKAFQDAGFSQKEAFELLKVWCAPNYAMIVQRMMHEELASAKKEQQEEEKKRPHLHLPPKS